MVIAQAVNLMNFLKIPQQFIILIDEGTKEILPAIEPEVTYA